MKRTETLKEVLEKWNQGDIVWSIELGVMSPGYEQAIQVLIFGILNEWGDKPLPIMDDPELWKKFNALTEETVSKFNKIWRYSGAQVGAARSAAFQFLRKGYAAVMNEIPDDQKIMVSDDMVPKWTT